jgi:malonyl-CoA O-methyltransferase
MATSADADARRLDTTAVAQSLRRLARDGQVPWLHGEVARRMGERLELIRMKPALVLDWWGHLGGSEAVLARALPGARRVVVEPTEELLARSRSAAQRPWWSLRRSAAQVEVQSDRADLPPGVQMVWSNMMLHAVLDPPSLFARWQRALDVDGYVMFSCLGPGTLGELRALYDELEWPAPTPGYVDMHDLGDMLVHAGFADPVMDQETLTLRWNDPQALLAELRTLGGNAAPERFAGLRTPRWRRRLADALAARTDRDGRIGLSFEVAYGHAFKTAPRLPANETTTVSLQQMRSSSQ